MKFCHAVSSLDSVSFFTGDELNTNHKEGQESGFSHLFGAGCYNLQITFLLAK